MTVKITINNDENEGGHACEVHVVQRNPHHILQVIKVAPGEIMQTYVYKQQYVQVHSLIENDLPPREE